MAQVAYNTQELARATHLVLVRQPPENGAIVDQFITGRSDAEKKALYDFFRRANADDMDAKMSNIFNVVRYANEAK